MVGAVNGSVSMIAAKKKSGECRSVSLSTMRNCDGGAVASTVARFARMNVATRSKRLSLRTIRTPPISTIGSSARLPPTHQVAGSPSSSADSAAPKAAGLKMCFRPAARMNFEEIAQIEANTRTPTPRGSVIATGSRMSTRMSAVM